MPVMGNKRRSTVCFSTEEVDDRVLKSVQCPGEADYKEMEKILAFDCKCGGSRKENTDGFCIKQLSTDYIFKLRATMATVTEKEKDLMILMALHTVSVNQSDLTQRAKQAVQTKRKRHRTSYLVKGVPVCRDAFIRVYGISRTRLTLLHQSYKENGLMPPIKKRAGPSKHRLPLKHEDLQRVVNFINNYAEDNAIVLPGRHQGHKHFGGKLLPSHVTEAAVWRLYKESMTTLELRAVRLSSFRNLWRTFLPHISSTKSRTDLCWQCHRNNNYQVFESANLPEAVKSDKLKKQEQHLLLVQGERSVYQKMVADCKTTCQDLQLSLGAPTEAASKDIRMHYSFGFAQQVHYPSDPMQPGPIYFLTPRKCGLFGVCCEGIPQQVNYLIDEGMSSSSAVINYMHHFFNNYGVGETRVDLNCDNCSGQNKNKFVLWYCAWRTIHKLHHSLDLHFPITGHTKFAPDWCFGLIKQRFRKTRVNTLSEIAGVVKDSTVTGVNIPQLIGLEDGTVLVESYGWQQHLTPFFRPLPQIKQYQHFSFDALEPGVVVAKERPDSVGTRFQLLRNAYVLPPIDGLPVQAPPGLDTARQTYLFEKIREFCDEEAMDITCPAPKSRAGQKQALRM
ncbi:uncharacterized protein [Salvelinus alpinus]|uniref:uncharacterized protein n=1 Tax=Salvelinus alpinus TaxID=8036 RepID=UPI0039FC61B7